MKTLLLIMAVFFLSNQSLADAYFCDRALAHVAYENPEAFAQMKFTINDLQDGVSVWGRWDCKYCDNKNQSMRPIYGGKFCTGCGHGYEQGVDELWYPEDRFGYFLGSDIAMTPEEIKLIRTGPTWNCKHCKNNWFKNQHHCGTCGAPNPERVNASGVPVSKMATETSERPSGLYIPERGLFQP